MSNSDLYCNNCTNLKQLARNIIDNKIMKAATIEISSSDKISEKKQLKQAWEDFVLNHKKTAIEVRPEILNSWKRCHEKNLDPMGQGLPDGLSKEKLKKLLKKNKEILEISRPVMQMVKISVGGTGFILTLSEKSGYVLEVQGDKEILNLAIKNFYVPGALRSTDHAGTNGIGVCLDEEKPIQITGPEHFNINHHPWTCSSAPIKNSVNEIIGAVTLSGGSEESHQHTLALITAAAKNIESQLRERELIEKAQHLSSMLTSIYDSLSDGYIATDHSYQITHVNKAVQKMLGVKPHLLIGQPFFNIAQIEKGLMEHLRSGEYPETTEINFNSVKGTKSYLCRFDPIQTESFKQLGMIVTLSEKRQMVNIARRIGGNYAKYEFDDIKGKDREFLRQIEMAKIAAKTSSRVMIIGESGTGKELFAHAIHSHSQRKNDPFVAISCATIPRDLIESELFGYKGGAFTGARQKGMMGKFELSNNGTLFLDEINSLPLELQSKLLRVLQQNEIMRLGDNQTIPIDVRIITASNTDLMDGVEAGSFREDLYYRLNVMEIYIPPLRARKEDVDLLIDYIVERLCVQMDIVRPEITDEVNKILHDYHWPGNIRELENTMERALLLCGGQSIKKEHLPPRYQSTDSKFKNREKESGVTFQQGFRGIVENALKESKGNVSMAARQLNIARSTLYRKMREFNIQ